MKKILNDFLATSIISIFLIAGLELLAQHFNNDYSYKSQYMQCHAEEITTLTLGSSLALYDIDPYIIGDGQFNAGTQGKNIYYDVQLLEKHIPAMKNLHTVLYPIYCDMMIMRDYGAKSPRNYMVHTFMGLNYPRKEDRIFTKCLSLAGNLNIGTFRTEVACRNCDSLGFCGHAQNASWRPKYKRHAPCHEDEFTQYLVQLAKVCSNHGVRLIAFTCPTHANEFNTHSASQICQKSIENAVGKVKIQYPIEFKNYMGDPQYQHEDLYYDWIHLNRKGAEIFTQQLKEDFVL